MPLYPMILKTDKEGADIYPRDFIINLPSPSNYIGALRIFSDEEKYQI